MTGSFLSRLLVGLLFVLLTGFIPVATRAEILLRSVNVSDIRTTSPLEDSDGPTSAVLSHMLEGLVAFDDQAGIVPMLAQDYTVSDDGLSYHFLLRDGVRFHNGKTLDAEDVLFAWNRYLSEESLWRCKPDFSGKGVAKITEITAPDDKTIIFKIDHPWALFLATMARVDCMQAGIFHRDSLGEDGQWRELIGTGPFMVGDWQHGKHFDLVAFKDYSARTDPKTGLGGDKTPFVDRVRMLTIPDSATARAALMAGDIDVIGDAQLADLKELEADSHITVKGAPSFALAGVLFGLQPSMMQDVRMRRALAHTLDYQAIAQIAMQGLVPPNNSPIPTTSRFYNDITATMHATDPQRALDLLREAGYGGETIILTTNNRDPYALQSATLVQAMAAQVGLNIQIETLEFGAYISRYLQGDYQLALMGFSPRLDPSLTIDSISGDRSIEKRKVWNDPVALDLLYKSMEIADDNARQEIFNQLHIMFLESVPMIQLFNVAGAFAVRDNVEFYSAWAGGTPRFWGVRMK